MDPHQHLSRRERQIMDILFAEGEASVNVIRDQLPDPQVHTAVRTMLKILDGKGLIKRPPPLACAVRALVPLD